MKLDYERGKLTLRFEYDAAVVSKIKDLNCGTFNKPYKVWEFPATNIAYQKLKNTFGVKNDAIENWILKRKKIIDLSKYKFHTEPLPHQREALKVVLSLFRQDVK